MSAPGCDGGPAASSCASSGPNYKAQWEAARDEAELRREWVEVGEGHARLALEALARRCGELQASVDRLRAEAGRALEAIVDYQGEGETMAMLEAMRDGR